MSQISNRPVDWETLVKENEDRLYRAALAILGDAQEAEDAVQDTFLKFLEKAPADVGQSSRLADAGAGERVPGPAAGRLAAAEKRPPVGVPPAPEPEERQELEEIFSLPPADRAVIHLFYYGDSPPERSPDSQDRRRDRPVPALPARSRLRRLLEGETK